MKQHDGRERDIPDQPWKKAGLTALVLVILLTAGWEMLWRSKGYYPAPVDSSGFWAMHRRAVSEIGDPTVIIGSSRALFDVNLDVWEELTGDRPIQLALEGTSPVWVLKDLAADSAFSGTVIVGVTPPLFFTGEGYRKSVVDARCGETPSERFSQQVAMRLERHLAFLEDNNLPLFTLLYRLRLPKREGVDPLGHPLELDIHKLSVSDEDRNTRMWARAAEDSTYRKLAQDVWTHFLTNMPPPPPDALPPDPMDIVSEVRPLIESIRARGGDVVFIRPPSSGIWRDMENKAFNRAAYWDVAMDSLDVGSVHFEDHPSMMNYDLPEWSHLTAEHAELYTAELAPLVQEALRTRMQIKAVVDSTSSPQIMNEEME